MFDVQVRSHLNEIQTVRITATCYDCSAGWVTFWNTGTIVKTWNRDNVIDITPVVS
jgi:hypothetical protein